MLETGNGEWWCFVYAIENKGWLKPTTFSGTPSGRGVCHF